MSEDIYGEETIDEDLYPHEIDDDLYPHETEPWNSVGHLVALNVSISVIRSHGQCTCENMSICTAHHVILSA